MSIISGGFAECFRVERMEDKKSFALKIINKKNLEKTQVFLNPSPEPLKKKKQLKPHLLLNKLLKIIPSK